MLASPREIRTTVEKSMRLNAPVLLLGASYLIVSIAVELVGESFSPNIQLFLIINGTQNAILDWLMIALSSYGQAPFWILIVLLLWILGRKEHKRTAFLLAATFLLAIILGESSKIITNLPRPMAVLSEARVLTEATGSAFPSGHAVIVSAGATVALQRLSWRISIPLTAEALLVSYSRVHVGVHWPLDILGGWLLGGFCAVLILSQATRLEPAIELVLSRWSRVIERFKRLGVWQR